MPHKYSYVHKCSWLKLKTNRKVKTKCSIFEMARFRNHSSNCIFHRLKIQIHKSTIESIMPPIVNRIQIIKSPVIIFVFFDAVDVALCGGSPKFHLTSGASVWRHGYVQLPFYYLRVLIGVGLCGTCNENKKKRCTK